MALRATDLDRIYTPEEFEALPQFGGRYELENGRIIEKPMAGDEHGAIIRRLILALAALDPESQLGVWWTQTNVNFGDGWVPAPDFTFVKAERVGPETPGSIGVLPDLVVEVQSPSDLKSKPERDAAQNKIKKYQERNVRLIWSVNPQKQTIEVYHSDQPAPVATLGLDDELTAEDVIPGFKIALRKLFK